MCRAVAGASWSLFPYIMAWAILSAAHVGAADRPPNFVVIMADDLGAAELGCYGNGNHRTPRLDRLAKEGMRFRTCFATPKCTPTRIMIMTGRYGFRTGWFSFLERSFSPMPGSPRFDIGTAEVTFADVLKQRRYATGIAGKWQLPGSPSGRIYDCGFDTYCMWMWKHELPDIDPVTGKDRTPYDPTASLHAGKGRGNRYWDPDIMADAKRLPTKAGDYGPDVFADWVGDFMQDHRDEPFFVYYPMVLVHKHGGTWPPVPDRQRPGAKTAEGLQPNVEYMDHVVGTLLDRIDELGLRENTFVFFTGDNGTADDGKGEVIERGARVPLIVRGPGVSPDVISDELADLTDVLPTLAELADAPLPEDRTIDGVSLVPTLLGQPGPKREWIFSYLNDERMLRDKRWLLEGDGQFYDCGDRRDGTGYRNVTDSSDPEVVEARRRFETILEDLPAPKERRKS